MTKAEATAEAKRIEGLLGIGEIAGVKYEQRARELREFAGTSWHG